MASTPRIATWVAWYLDQAQKDGPLGDLDSKPLSYFDSVPTAYLSQPIRFVAEVATHEGRNFLVLPSGGNGVRFLHQGFAFPETVGLDPSVFGIWGARESSPFKKVTVQSAIAPLNVPRVTTRKSPDSTIPNVEQFLGTNNAQEFADLVGGPTDSPISALEKSPCSFWMHPYLFRILEGVASARAADVRRNRTHRLLHRRSHQSIS